MKFLGLIFLIGALSANATNTTATTPHTAVLYTKVLSKPEGLCINAALNLGITCLSFGATWLLSANFNQRVAASSEPTKAMAAHAVDNPFHVLSAAIITGVGIASTSAAMQNFIAAVQNWYVTPSDIAGLKVSDL
ncbi:MAG: hypothetical protein WCK49_06460 [Myxococcaceae bacterium]